MSRKTAPPSASRRLPRRATDAREWLGGIRFSGFTAIMLGLVVLGVAVLSPTVATYVEQRQKIAAMQESVQVTKDEIAALERERERWKDPAYITTQARERLYYVKPGEVRFLVIDDLEATQTPQDPEPVSAEVEEKSSDWTGSLLRSIVGAGTAETAMEITIGVPDDPAVTETPAP
ncbi:FtsB family cell division protein [Microbacterium sp. JZ31]|uniref:FtsB family cell division protein n=1 Tax=Microbacterium sp. JZ31 TaxID=1906274 RepID=UPI001EE3CC9D|nr:septum formation initiator family protein [Microbacterium sp. JZ31]